jgi:hypothetical protein
MWWVFRMIWPQARRQVTTAALLFAVYPVFFKQPIAVAFHQHWTGYLLYFVSLAAMLLSLRSPRRRMVLVLGSLLAMGMHLAIFEYFAGAELLRPILLWLYLGAPGLGARDRLGQTLKAYLPYFIVLAGFSAGGRLRSTIRPAAHPPSSWISASPFAAEASRTISGTLLYLHRLCRSSNPSLSIISARPVSG